MDGAGLRNWEWGDPCEVAASRELAMIRKKRTVTVPSCDGCKHLDRVFERPVCLMGIKKVGQGCRIYDKGEGIK